MDHNNQINLDDFIEVEPEQNYIVMHIGQKHKKLKNYNKAIQKFEKSLDKELYYFQSLAENFILEGKYQGHVIIDQAGNVTEIEDIPIIGTQMILQEREIIYQDQFKHLINIDPKKYFNEEQDHQEESRFKNLYQMIQSEQKPKKQKKRK